MFDKLWGIFELLINQPGALPYFLAILAFICLIIYLILKRQSVYSWIRHKPKEDSTELKDIAKEETDSSLLKVIPILGTGKFHCAAIRSPKVLGLGDDVNIIDFTTMPKPMGELHFADTSCPFAGGFYTVKEKADGTLEDWDYKSRKIVAEETPEFAYDATHPPDMTPIFRAKYNFLKDSSFWYGVAAFGLAFFSVMGAMGQ